MLKLICDNCSDIIFFNGIVIIWKKILLIDFVFYCLNICICKKFGYKCLDCIK